MPSPILISRSYAEFEEFDADTREWQVETAMLNRGGFRADVLHAINMARGHHFAHARMDGHVRQEGEPPCGLRTICVPGDDRLSMDWRHQHVAGDDMLVFPPGGELQGVLRPGFDMFFISMRDDVLAEHVAAGTGIDSSTMETERRRCDPRTMRALRRHLRSYAQALAAGLPEPAAAAGFDEIVHAVVRTLIGSERQRLSVAPQRRIAARRAAAFAEAHASEAPTVSKLCRVANASYSTLERGFKELFGIGPKTYVNALRLNGFRRDLRQADPQSTVIADLANKWGFWHMGQLAADYRLHFSELPSATLAR